MELAGQACAVALAKVYDKTKYPRVLVCCGPGNQGGDGLVAARHLGTRTILFRLVRLLKTVGCCRLFRVQTFSVHAKARFQGDLPGPPTLSPPYTQETTDETGSSLQRLKTQCDNMQIQTTSDLDSLKTALRSSDVILDAVFGFSFKPPIRAPFDEVLPLLTQSKLPVVSVDIPSGWDVEGGRPSDPLPGTSGSSDKKVDALDPDVLISLTAPKEGTREYRGRHFLGGRFVPKSLDEKFGLSLPEYPGTDLVVELPAPSEGTTNRL